jgi:hypothetical protein
MTNPQATDFPVAEGSSPGLQLIQTLRSFFCSSGQDSLPLDRQSDWHCRACNVWGRDVRPATCWCCGTEDVDYRVAPSMSGGQRFRDPVGPGGA